MLKKFIILLAMTAVAAAQTPNETEAVAAMKRDYDAGNYDAARKVGEELLQAGARNPAIFVNLGHANHRLGRDVQASVNYRRALALDPSNTDARRGLEQSRAKLGLPGPGLGVAEIVGQYISFDLLAWSGSILSWCGILTVLFAVFSTPLRRKLCVAGALVALVGVTASVVSWSGDARIALKNQSVVIEKDVEALETPTDNAKKLAALPMGAEVTVIASRDEWTLVRLPTGIEGWVKSSSLEALALD